LPGVAVGSGPGGATVTSGQPCRVDSGDNGAAGLSGATTAAPGGGASVSINPADGGTGVAVGSGASGDGSSAAAGTNCVVVKPGRK
jgi:hypothetical protein